MRRIFSGSKYANVVSTMALVVALGGTSAYAATQITGKSIKNGSIKAKDLGSNSVTSSKVKNGVLLAKDFKSGQLKAGPAGPRGAAGVTGATGATGAAGAQGAAAVKLFATVNESGAIVRSSPGVTIAADGVGIYRLTFPQDVSGCTPVASIGITSVGNNLQAGEASAGVGPVGTKVVSVSTRSSAGAFAAAPFQLIVACP